VYAGQRLQIPAPGSAAGATHVVQRGEALASIARRYGVTVSALVQANGLNNPNFVYVGQRLRIPAGRSPGAGAGAAPVTSKLIDIDLSNQRMTVWENGRVKWYWVCSTGEPGRPTYPGRFGVISKIPNAYSSVYHLQMPWWLGIYWAGNLQNGIHALPLQSNGQTLWAGFLGRRVSYGCIILDTDNARALYQWADMGTPVTIHY
jgi:lipoprotein-anchoring transpeptidase ErfK/SrfK